MRDTIISTAELEARLGDPHTVVVDVRHDLGQPDTWGEAQYRAAHVPGAGFLHIDRDLSGPKNGRNGRHPLPTPENAAAVFGRAGIGPNTQVVAYDQSSGSFAARLWWMLRWLGHDAVAVLDGGWDKWARESRPSTTDVVAREAQRFAVPARPLPTASVETVLSSLPRHSMLLIDARSPERFRGEVEPMDPVAGRIPGAVNRPASTNLRPDGTMRDPAELRKAFESLIGDRPVASVVHSCGSGVTACHNILAMKVAGMGDTMLYPGSWSEWSADPSRPIAKGPA